MSATPNYRFVGVTDECVECQQCGKPNLKSTVVLSILDVDGNHEDYTYYGSTCAARALAVKGGGRAVLQSARWAHYQTLTEAADARRMLNHYGLPETGDPDRDTVTEAMRRYVRAHYGITRLVAESGIGVRARVLDMLARKRAAIAAADVLTRKAA